MPTTNLTPTAPATDADAVPVADNDDLCLACAHPASAHDTISARYCSASMAAGLLTRGCVCPRGK